MSNQYVKERLAKARDTEWEKIVKQLTTKLDYIQGALDDHDISEQDRLNLIQQYVNDPLDQI